MKAAAFLFLFYTASQHACTRPPPPDKQLPIMLTAVMLVKLGPAASGLN